MSERQDPLAWIDDHLAAATIAHEHIAELHWAAPDDRSLRLLRESADIVLRRVHALLGPLRRSAAAWAEQEVLDPDRAAETRRRIEAELTTIEPELQSLLQRQVQIARELRGRR